ncbi:recombinase family protein [Actinomadura sp. CNU-125]|uniref:recombinase family protein n=1 Tax=Actinomadura sp. CNU-125 TaxID=1904961 RepID=UPI0039670620
MGAEAVDIRAGVDRDNIHSPKASRPELDLALQLLRESDTLKVTRLDRLSRSVLHLVTLGADLRGRGIELHVIEQGIDTSTIEGRAMRNAVRTAARGSWRTPTTGSPPRGPRPDRRASAEADRGPGCARPAALRRVGERPSSRSPTCSASPGRRCTDTSTGRRACPPAGEDHCHRAQRATSGLLVSLVSELGLRGHHRRTGERPP